MNASSSIDLSIDQLPRKKNKKDRFHLTQRKQVKMNSLDSTPLRSSREHSEAALAYANQEQDIEATNYAHKTRLHNLRIELMQAEKEDLENDRKLESIRLQKQKEEEASKSSLMAEQRFERQQTFRNAIDDNVIDNINLAVANDQVIETALRMVVDGKAEESDLEVVQSLLSNELAGNDLSFWQAFAARVLRVHSDDESLANSNNQSNFSSCNTKGQEDNGDHDEPTTTIEAFAVGTSGCETMPADNDKDEAQNKEIKSTGPISTTEQTQDLLGNIAHSALDVGIVNEVEIADSVADKCDQTPRIVKREASIETLPGSAKRPKLTEIENTCSVINLPPSPGPLQTGSERSSTTVVGTDFVSAGRDIRRLSADSTISGLKTPVKENNRDDGNHADRAKKHNEVGRNTPSSVSSSSKASTCISEKGSAKKAVDASSATPFKGKLKAFVDNLVTIDKIGHDVGVELDCQRCAKFPKEPRLANCGHLYCSQCLSIMRGKAYGDPKTAPCIVCNRGIGARGSIITPTEIKTLKKRFIPAKAAIRKGPQYKSDSDDDEASIGAN